MNNKKEFIEKRHYKGKPNSDIINYPVVFRRTFFDTKNALTIPVYAHRIIFKILNDISMDQFNPNNINQSKQLSLFNDELMTDNNSFVRFTFNINDISSHRDYKEIKNALNFLENYKKQWYKSKNTYGKFVSTLGGLISVPVISKGNISFLVSNYWFEKLVKLSSYNVTYFRTIWKLSNSKQIMFYLWLLEIPTSGTRIGFDLFQDRFDYHYKTPKDLAKNVLKSYKNKLDKYSNKSFNYSIKDKLLIIKPYFTEKVNFELETKTFTNQKIIQKISYWKDRHKISLSNINTIKSVIKQNKSDFHILLKSYKNFIKDCRINQKKATDFIDDDFMVVFQEHIIKTYEDSIWNQINNKPKKGYPTII